MSAVSFWSSLDGFDDTQLAETEAERWEFDQKLREEHGTKQQESAETCEPEPGRPLTRAEVARKIGRRDRRVSSGITVRPTVTTVARTTTTEITHSVIVTNPVSSISTPLRSEILVAETPATRARTRSCVVLHTPIASPVDPVFRSRRIRTLDTPTHIESPETTLAPTTSASPTPNSIMPPRKNSKMGSALVPVTAHHALITEAIKEKPKIKAVRAGEGPLSGMKFFFPGVEERVMKEKSARDKARMWYGIILEAGGQVEPEYTPEAGITHLVWDEATSPAGRAKFCSYLGITSLEELPETTVVIKTPYISACKKHRSKMAPAAFLSFPPPPRATSRKLAPLNIAAPSKRSTDITSELKPSRSSARSRRSESQDSTDSFPHRHQRVSMSPGDIQLRDDLIPTEEPITQTHHITSAAATEHAVQSGPGWTMQSGAQADGLDLMIAGVVKGDALVEIDDDADSDTEPETDPVERAAKRRKLVAEGRRKLREEATATGGRYQCMRKNSGEPKDRSDAPNEYIAKKLDELHDTYEAVEGKNSFSVVAYRKAAGIMRRTLVPIRTKAEALELKGIGDNLATRIEEIATNNPFGRAYFEDTAESRTVQVFKGIYGVGAVRARELYKMGARSLDDLKTGRFGLTEGQSIGLKLYHELQQRIPRAECQAIFTQVHNLAIALDPKIEIEIMGSYRRGAEDSGDVDMLLTRDTSDGFSHAGILPQLMKLLFDAGIFTHTLSAPSDPMALEAKWMGLARADPKDPTSIHRRVDILCIPFEQRGAALLYFTGNDIFNRSLRLYARKNGYSLNQRGLYKGVIRNRITQQKETEGELVASRTEQEIFNVLGIRWRPPHHRRP